jgi:predicted KAP-like P-loop ATPase
MIRLPGWLWRKRRSGRTPANDGSSPRRQAYDSNATEPPSESAQDQASVSSDVPIKLPSQDAYGIDGFAKALARSISRANASEGLVFAVHGPWGSGKSSACNLILYRLDDDITSGRLVPVTFNPWWFTGREALTLAFFQELGASIGRSLSDQAREALASLGARLSSAGSLLGSLASVFGLPGSVVENATTVLGNLTKIDQTVEEVHKKVSDDLHQQRKRFLIVIDDIDRLGTEEALEIFRLVKSVGRLPNVIYLLAFDRALAEKMVEDHFPSEGPSYLEKFIQGGFDLPLPEGDDLREVVLRVVSDVMGSPPEEKLTRFWNLFHDVCAPFLKLPRDAVRLSNTIRVSWPAIRDDADRTDFLALEAMRLFLPSVHRAIRANPAMLCGAPPHSQNRRGEELAREYDETFLSGLSSREQQIAKRALMRLFPRTEHVWSNVLHTSADIWRRDRLVCSETHFPTYFAFSVGDEAVPAGEIQEVIDAAGDADAIAALMRRFVEQSRRRGGTRAALVLDELAVRAGDIPDGSVQAFLEGLFSVVDDLDVDADESRGFGVGNNPLRVHWLLNNLVRDRFEQGRRGELIEAEAVCQRASLGWLLDIARRCRGDHDPRENEQGEQREPLVPLDVANRLRDVCLTRIRAAAADGSLGRQRRIIRLLFEWSDLAGK